MANRYWVGGSGTWNTSSTTNWSASSGGASGASVPTAADSVFFDQAGTYTVTCTGALTCLDITVSAGTVTFATGTSPTFAISGSMSLVAGTLWAATGAITFNATTTGKTITTNGVNISGAITLNGVGGGWTLGSALNNSTNTLTVTNGTFDTSSTSNYSLTAGGISSSNSNTRTINLNASTVTLSGLNPIVFTTDTNLTFNAGTSQINITSSLPTLDAGTGKTFYNVTSTLAGITSLTFNGANTFNNLTFTARTSVGINLIIFSANQTINGTLNLGSPTVGAVARSFFRSSVVGAQRTLTVNSISGLTDIDFRDIVAAGASGTWSGTRLGNCGGNSNITFPAAKTVYYGQTGSANWGATGTGSWSATSGGALDATMFPLAQDTAIFPAATYPASGSTTTINVNYNIGTIDMSLRTSNTMTLATSGFAPAIYGNWINGTGITISGTNTLTFSSRSTQQITSAGIAFTQPIIINSTGTTQLQDAFTTGTGVSTTLSSGTISLQSYTLSTGTFSSSNSNTRTIAFGTGNITCTGTGIVCNTSTVTGLTTTGTQVVNVTSAGSTAITVITGALSEANSISYNFTGGTYALTFLNGTSSARNIDFTGYAGTLGAISGSTIYGNLKISTGMSLTASTNTLTFGATSGTQQITTNGKTLDFPVTFNGVGGTFQLQDALTMGSTRTATLNNGTLDLSGKTMTVGTRFTTSSGTKNLTFNGGTLVCPDPNTTSFNNLSPTNFTTTAGTGTGTISMTAATAKTFVGGGSTFNCTLNQGGAGALTITGSNTFRDITNTTQPASVLFTAGTTTTFTSGFSLSGTAGNLITIGSVTAASHTLSKASGTVSVSYCSISRSTATGGAEWQAYTTNGNVDGGNNAGWVFSSGTTYNVDIAESASGIESLLATLLWASSISETSSGVDEVSALSVFNSDAAEAASGVDQVDTTASFSTNISETSSGLDQVDSQQDMVSFVSETGSGVDQVSSQHDVYSQIAEAASGLDQVDANFTVNADAVEASSGVDSASSLVVFGAAVSEAGSGVDDISASQTFATDVSEAGSGVDQVDVVQAFASSIAETSSGIDSQSTAATFNASINEPGYYVIYQQITSSLPTGTTFTGSTIFNSSSASGGLTVAANGTGSGSTGGFNAGGNYILFTGANTRSVKTIALNLTQAATVDFYMIKGTSSNGGELPDAGENITLSYSINGGSSYTVISTVIAGGATPVVNPFTLFNVTIPVGAKTASTILKWEEVTSTAGTFDTYGLKDITIYALGVVGASDSQSTVVDFGSAVTETASGVDSTFGLAEFGSSIEENGSAIDENSAAQGFATDVAETASGIDQTESTQGFASNVAETASALDEDSVAASEFNAYSQEQAAGLDEASAAQGFVSDISESASGVDADSALQDFAASVQEASSGQDSAAALQDFAAAIEEGVSGLDVVSSAADFSASFIDEAAGIDSISTATEYGAAIEAAASGVDEFYSSQDFAVDIAEGASSYDATDAAGSVYTANFADSASGIDVNQPNFTYNVIVPEGVLALDQVYSRYLWELIDNSETADWGTISNTQTASWGEINDTQAASWQNIANTQPDGWTEIDDTQNPNWGRITP